MHTWTLKRAILAYVIFSMCSLSFADGKDVADRLGGVHLNGKVLSKNEVADLYNRIYIPNPFIELTAVLMGHNALESLERECIKNSPLIRYSHVCQLGNGIASGALYLIVKGGKIDEYLIEADFQPMLDEMLNGAPMSKKDKREMQRFLRAIAKEKYKEYSRDRRKIYFDGYDLKIHHVLSE